MEMMNMSTFIQGEYKKIMKLENLATDMGLNIVFTDYSGDKDWIIKKPNRAERESAESKKLVAENRSNVDSIVEYLSKQGFKSKGISTVKLTKDNRLYVILDRDIGHDYQFLVGAKNQCPKELSDHFTEIHDGKGHSWGGKYSRVERPASPEFMEQINQEYNKLQKILADYKPLLKNKF
jgi:hypothetical protein|tara:strand:- start:1279 stop:1815 length:537 start_codon:yes stop_codon:yes gene_type:complete